MKKHLLDISKVKKAHNKLRNLYNKIPETIGCMENLDKCKSFCCNIQTPQVLYVEFLYTWNDILANWSLQDILDLIKSAVRCYLSNNTIKGCIFRNKDTGLCMQHKTRCFNCYCYGITPKEEFDLRLEKFKKIYEDKNVVFHDQCSLVKTKNGEEVTSEDLDGWWDDLVKIEHSIGIEKNLINDGPDGSYRTYHDHLVLHLLPDVVINQMTIIKMSIDESGKEACVQSLINCLANKIEII